MKHARQLRNPIEYQPHGRVFKPRKKVPVNFLLQEMSTSRKVEWEFNVDKLSEPTKAPYDMIIGTGLLTELAIDLRFCNQKILWDDLTAPMQTEKPKMKIR